MSILAIDQGTTSSRAILFDDTFGIAAMASCPIRQSYPAPGWVEHDPEELFTTVLKAAADCLAQSAAPPSAVGITNQRETVIVWEKATGRPIYPAIVWQCRRTAPLCEAIRAAGHAPAIKHATGLPVDAYFSATKIAWILDHVPQARKRAEEGELVCGTVDSWLIWRLTGHHATDITNASRTQLFDINKMAWDDGLCHLFGVPRAMLPDVFPSAHDYGRIVKSETIPACLHGLAICAVIGDQQAALFGQKCLCPGEVKNTYGTGCFTLMNIGEKPVFDENIITTPAWFSEGQPVYALEGSVFNAGSAVQWLRDELGVVASAQECSALAPTVPSTGGAVFVPAFTGLGAPYWDMYARGAFLGITRGTNRAHLCRAVLEGIAFQVAELLSAMEKAAGRTITSLKADGGASTSEFLMQFQADLLGIPVCRPPVIETTAKGAALMAALSCGLLSPADLAAKEAGQTTWQPCPDRAEADAAMKRWQKAVAALRQFGAS